MIISLLTPTSAMVSLLSKAQESWFPSFWKCSRMGPLLKRLLKHTRPLTKSISKQLWNLLLSSQKEVSSLSLPKMKFLFDENVHRGLFSFLSKLGHGVKLSPKGIENGEVFGLALSEQRLLITRDKHFTEEQFFTSKHFGIWLLRIRAKDLEAQKHSISKLLKQHSPEEFNGKGIKLLPDDFEFL